MSLLLSVILLPLAIALILPAFKDQPNRREAITLFGSGALFLLCLKLFSVFKAGELAPLVLAEPLPGIQLMLNPEPLGISFSLLVSFLWPITSLYAIGYMRGHEEQNQTRFYCFFALSIAVTQAIALSGNMLTLFLFYELLTLATFPLVTHTGTEKAKKAGRIYLGILMGTSILFLLLAIVWSWHISGNLDFKPGGVFPAEVDTTLLSILLLLFVLGTAKAAIMPFHRWLPNAMVAPVPVSALLHAVAVVKAGVFTILKVVVYLFGLDLVNDLYTADVLAYLAGFTLVVASLIALRQDNIKARLAYSTIGQLSYIILGAMLAVESGILGGSMHIFTHAVGKITLFFCAGAILLATHKTCVSELNGLGKQIPITLGLFTLAALSTIGLPPFAGLWSKWWLVESTLVSEMPILTAALLISSLLNLAYLLEIPIRGFFMAGPNITERQEAPKSCLIAASVTAFSCVALFFYPDVLFNLLSGITGGSQ